MIIITKYRQEEKHGKIYIRTEETSICPICTSELQVVGSRSRKVIVKGSPTTLVIRRLQCKKCRKIHHELPDLLVPYKRHCVQTIEQIVSEHPQSGSNEAQSDGFHRTTARKLRNWWDYLNQQFNYLRLSLEAKYNVQLYCDAPKELIRAFTNSHSWVQTRTAHREA